VYIEAQSVVQWLANLFQHCPPVCVKEFVHEMS
jgi:hypothetical protein